MSGSHEKRNLIIAGLIIGAIAGFLVLAGNPGNMGFCIACFVRDTVGGLGLHRAAPVQYIRPEIIGLILGAYLLSMIRGEHQSKGGSSPIIRIYSWLLCYDWCVDVPWLSNSYDFATWRW